MEKEGLRNEQRIYLGRCAREVKKMQVLLSRKRYAYRRVCIWMQNDSDNGYPRTGKEARLVSETGAPFPSMVVIFRGAKM